MIGDTPRYTQVLGGGVGGLKRDDVPRVVSNLLKECREREVKLTIRPERVGSHYTVEWQYLEFDHDASAWQPLADLPGEEERDV